MGKTPGSEHGGNIYKALREQGAVGTGFLDFSANINPLGIASQVRKQLNSALDNIIHYPDAEAHDLKTAIADFYQVDYNQITVGNGAVELLYVLCHLTSPRRVLIPAPAFSEYERAARACGAKVDYYYLSEANDFSFYPAGLASLVSSVDLVFIGNPNNPTGTLLTSAELVPLIEEAAKYDCLVVVDESFIDFLPDAQPYTCRYLMAKYPNLIVLHSLTKFHAIPGLRLGFALTSSVLAAGLDSAKDPWNVNSLAQAAGVAALQPTRYWTDTRAIVQNAKQQLFDQLNEIPGLKNYFPAVNFILVNLTATGIRAGEARKRLFDRGILVRDCSNYPGLTPFFIRLAVKLPEQNAIIIRALQKILIER